MSSGVMTWERTFTGVDSFQAIEAARTYLRERGYSVGVMCGDLPMAIMKGDYLIAKWRNLDSKERAMVDGRIEGDMRNGPVTVYLREAPERP